MAYKCCVCNSKIESGEKWLSVHKNCVPESIMQERHWFLYDMMFTCESNGQMFELHKEFRSPVQFNIGDSIYLDGEDEGVPITKLIWWLNEPGRAWMALEDVSCDAIPTDIWGMDTVWPPLEMSARTTG